MASAAVHQGTALATVPNEGPARDDGWRPLAAGWVVLPTDRLAGFPVGVRPRERRFLLMHAEYGIVVLELWSAGIVPDGASLAAAWLDAELRLAAFLRRFDPRLPICRIHLAAPELPRLVGVLTRAFAGTEPLCLPCGDAWMGAVQATLAASPDAVPAPAAAPRPRAYPRPARWRGVAAGATGAVALGGVVIAALLFAEGRPGTEKPRAVTGEGPAVVAAPVFAAPPSVMMAGAPPAQADARPEPDAPDPMTPSTAARMASLPEPEAQRLPPFGAISVAAAEPLPTPEAAPPAAPIAIGIVLADAPRPPLPPPSVIAPPPPPLPGDAARIAPLPKPAGAPHPAQRMPRDAGTLLIAPLPTPVALRLLPVSLAGSDLAQVVPLPMPAALHPVRLAPAVVDAGRVAPLPEPDAVRLPPLAPAVADGARVALPPEPDTLRLTELTAASADAERAAPVPEPDAVRLPPLAPGDADTTRAAPLPASGAPQLVLPPEPGTPRIAQRAPEDAGAAQDAPLPETDAPRPAPIPPATPAVPSDAGTVRAAPAPPPAPASHDTRRVVPSPAPEAQRVGPPVPPAEAVRQPPPVAPPAAAAPAPVAAPAPTLDPKMIELLLTRGNEMLARGDISAARLLFGRAAAAGSVAALIAMGRSYDPAVLGALGVRGIRPDPEQAALWYRRAAERGAAPDGRSER